MVLASETMSSASEPEARPLVAVERRGAVTVITDDGRTYPAEVMLRDEALDFAHLRVREADVEPLQLGVLAGLTPPDVEIAMYDDRLESIPYDEPTDLVAITVETYTARRAYEISAEFRRRDCNESPLILSRRCSGSSRIVAVVLGANPDRALDASGSAKSRNRGHLGDQCGANDHPHVLGQRRFGHRHRDFGHP